VRTALARARADLVGSDAEIALAAEVVALRQQRADRLETRVSAGEDNRFLAYTARTELVVSERRLAEAQARRDLAATALAKALGVSPAAVQRLPLAPPPPAALSGLPQWRREAALYRRDVLRAVADYDLAENALRLEVAKQYPDVHLAPAYNWDHGVLKLPFGLAMTLPPTDLNRASIRQAEAARAAAGRSLETVQANALAAVDAAAAALVAAQANLERARDRDVPNAERVMESTERGLRLGAVDRTDDLAARAALGDVRLNLMDAERAYRLAIADLEDTLHHVFDPVEAAVLQAQTDIEGDAR
jgi:CRISPR system Cascade subunit CasA